MGLTRWWKVRTRESPSLAPTLPRPLRHLSRHDSPRIASESAQYPPGSAPGRIALRMEPEPGPTLASDEDLDCVLAVAEGDVPGAFALDVHKRQLRELLEDVKAGKWPSGQPRSFSPTYSGKASAEDFVKSTVSYVVFAPHLEPLKQFAVHLGDGAKLPTCPTCHDHQGVELKEWKWDALRVVTGLGRNLVVLFPAYKCKGCRGACTWRPGREEGDSAAAAGAADQWRVAHGRGEAVAACGGARHAARAGRRARGSGARLPMSGQQGGNPTSCPLALLTGAKDDAKSTVFSAYSPQLVEELERRDKATGSVDAALFLEAMPFVLTGHGGIAKELVQRLLTQMENGAAMQVRTCVWGAEVGARLRSWLNHPSAARLRSLAAGHPRRAQGRPGKRRGQPVAPLWPAAHPPPPSHRAEGGGPAAVGAVG